MRALDRLIGVLEAVAAGRGPVTASSVATTVDLSLSTASRLLRLLADEGLLSRAGQNGTYVLGSRLLLIVGSAMDQTQLLEAALPAMETLRDKTGETVSLHIRSGDQRVCIAEVQSRHAVRRVVPPGFTVSLHRGATGEVLLAATPVDARERYLSQLEMADADLKALRSRLNNITRAGWAIAIDALEVGLSGMAAPVRRDGRAVASLSISGPSNRWTRTAMRAHVGDVVSVARQISMSR